MSCEECGRRVHARGLCAAHYNRLVKKGLTPLVNDQRSAPLKERFLKKFVTDQNGCWRWTGAHRENGYGLIWKGNKNVAAHREAYRLFIGPLSEEEVVCHRCDVRNCVNPDHLFVGDRALNNLDMRLKRRHRFGESSPLSKLTAEDAEYIRRSTEPSRELCNRFHVNQSTISRIKSGKRWGVALSAGASSSPPD